jgi:NADPH-dependent 2,4-dienoyl-CoA reductase/sulfur reductase-like enzyme
MSSARKILIIGNGIAGVTCARELRKRNSSVEITIVSGESEHFFSRTALMYIYMGHMKYAHTKPYEDHFWSKNRITLVWDWVDSLDFKNKKAVCRKKGTLDYDVLVLATGSKPNRGNWPGEQLNGVQGLYSLQDLELMEQNTKNIKKAVIVGGGLIGIEMAEMLHSRKVEVIHLVRENHFWNNILPDEEASLLDQHIRSHHIDLRLNTELKTIKDDGKGSVSGVETKDGHTITCEFVGLAIGVSPNVDFLKSTELEINRGILVDFQFRTNMPDVYAIGDCAEFKDLPGTGRKSQEQVWYTGRMHGETLGFNLGVNTPVNYKPGPWFNSAKFFDLEYQTYGIVPAVWGDAFHSYFWKAEDGKACFRILYDRVDHTILGVNTIGWRLSHPYFDEALQKGKKVEQVMGNLKDADFNPEFYQDYCKQIIRSFEQETGIKVERPDKNLLQRIWRRRR